MTKFLDGLMAVVAGIVAAEGAMGSPYVFVGQLTWLGWVLIAVIGYFTMRSVFIIGDLFK